LTRTGKATARKKVKEKKKYSVAVVRYSAKFGLGKRASFGDLVIKIEPDEKGLIWVYPPSRIVHLKPYTNSNGAQKVLVFTEEPRNPKCLEWKVFKAALKKGDVPNVNERIWREITNINLKQTLLGMWVSRHEK
jgi:hypothetical protein